MKTEKILGYDVHRKKVKNINLRINQNMEVCISAPLKLHKDYIENFIRSKENWIKKVIEKLKEIKSKTVSYEYRTGEIHRFMGKEYVLKVIEGKDRVSLKNDTILLIANDINDMEKKKNIMEKWYFENAKKVFLEVIEKWLKILDEKIEHLSIRRMKTRWGSCNYKKRYINLNTDLVKRSMFEIEYVVLHELTHLKYPNHGKGFYRYMENYMPNYRKAEKLLNAKHYY